jgi:hypothetical protein
MISPNIFLEPAEQANLQTLLGQGQTISAGLAKSADYLAEGKGWAESLLCVAPWLQDVADAAEEFKVVAFIFKLGQRWLSTTNPYELGAVACTRAFQKAAHAAIQQVWKSAIGYGQALKVDNKAAQRIRTLPPAEAANLSTFDLETALHHPFVHRANEILRAFLTAADFEPEQQIEVINLTQRGFVRELRRVLTDARTAEKFAPFKEAIGLGAAQTRAENALLIHAKYQVAQYAARPLFNSEPYALKDVYAEMQCGRLTWRELRAGENPYEAFPEDLLKTTLRLIYDKTFNDVIVVQGAAGAGKSSFTLRLSAELWQRGFVPLRVRMKRLQLGDSLYASIGKALELEDEDRLDGLPSVDKEALLNRALLRTPYAGDGTLAQYVLIFDGWDEMELTDNRAFRDQVRELVNELRRQLLDGQERPRVRVILTGRPTHEIDNKVLNPDTPVLSVLPFTPPQFEEFVARLKAAVESQPVPQPDWKPWAVPPLSVFTSVFEQYAKLYDEALPDPTAVDAGPDQDEWHEGDDVADELAEELDAEDTAAAPDTTWAEAPEMPLRSYIQMPELPDKLEILGLPLLSYLTIRVMSQTVARVTDPAAQQTALQELLDKPTTLYRRLTDLTCPKAAKSVLAPDAEEDIARQLRYSGADLREKLRRTAAAMAVLGREWITKEEWEPRVLDEADRANEDFTAAHPLMRLMVSFYFRGSISEQSKEHSVEFVHKTFREYLFAEAIVEALKTFGRAAQQGQVERDHWRDFEPDRQKAHYDLSRQLSELLAPQWLKPEVLNHIDNLLAWEIGRAPDAGQAAAADLGELQGEPTEALTLRQWQVIREGMAALWAWWADQAHLRPQVQRKGRHDFELLPAYIHELNDNWVRPRAQKLDLKLPLESPTALDAHLGDGLCQLTAWVHSHLVEREGDWPGWPVTDLANLYPQSRKQREEFTRVRAERVPVVPVTRRSGLYQTFVCQGGRTWTVFAPSGEPVPDNFLAGINLPQQAIRQLISRISAAPARRGGDFPTEVVLKYADLRGASLEGVSLENANLDNTNLDGADLTGADLNGASLNGASLDGAFLSRAGLIGAHLIGAHLFSAVLEMAFLDRARLDHADFKWATLKSAILDGADLSDALNVTIEQLAQIGSLNEETKFPPGAEFDQLKQKLLQRQREREKQQETE